MSRDSVVVWCVVPAAGVGRRMGSAIPKQYLSLNERTVLEHTLDRLLSLPFIQQVHVSISKQDEYFPTLNLSEQITVVEGGSERCDSVLNGLRAIAPDAGKNDWVLVHDAARCCVCPDNVKQLFDSVVDNVAADNSAIGSSDDSVGGLLALPASDTLKQADNENRVVATVDRSTIWQAQTPQLFRFGLLLDALEKALEAGFPVTDEASAIEYLGYSPKLVVGRNDNIKVTAPEDLVLAEFIQQNQIKKT